jgi:hypothetical protein
MKCQLSKRSPSLYTVVVALLGCACSATSVVVLITPAGIVIGADSISIGHKIGKHSGPDTGAASVRKIFVIRDRVAVGTVGLGGQTLAFKGKEFFSYDAARFLGEVNNQAPEGVTVGSVVEIIEDRFSPILQVLQLAIKNGVITQNSGFSPFVFVVAGYDGQTATVREIWFNVDWNKKELSGPIVKNVLPHQGARADFGLDINGVKTAIEDALSVPSSAAHKMVASEVPAELGILTAHKDLTIKQAITLLHALLRAQHKYTPDEVAAPYRVVSLLKNGGVKRVYYSH